VASRRAPTSSLKWWSQVRRINGLRAEASNLELDLTLFRALECPFHFRPEACSHIRQLATAAKVPAASTQLLVGLRSPGV